MIDPVTASAPSVDAVGKHARLLASAVAGLLLAASFPPFDWGFLAWVALVPLLWALSEASPRQAAGRGYVAGLLFMAGVGYFTTSFGGDVLWMRVLPWALFSLIEGLYFIPIAIALSFVLGRRPAAVLAGVPAVWALGEWGRAAGALGFPFGMLGYAMHAQAPAMQVASLGGVHMASAAVALASAGLYVLLFGGRAARRTAFGGLAVVIVSVLWGVTVVSRDMLDPHIAAPRETVVLAQGDAHHLWGDPEGLPAFDALIRKTLETAETAQSPVDLAVWSESSVPGYLLTDHEVRSRASRVARALNAPLLAGTIAQQPDGRPMNISVLVSPDGAVAGQYQKRRLVPFGEWVPFRHVLPLLDAFGVVEQDEAPGSEWNVLAYRRMRIGTPICFESAAPWVSRAFVRRGANVLAIITNDAWFFHTGMAEQHADLAQMRAVETGRWVIRCGLTGISGFISPGGLWRGRLPLDMAGGLIGSVELRTETTPFVRYGDWFPYLCIFIVLGVLFIRPRSVD